MQFSLIVQENTSSLFSWRGSLLGIFVGEHMFHFEEIPGSAEGDQSRTRFVQEEKFTGLISFVMGEGLLAKSIGTREDTKKGFEGFNRDFKTWVEQEK
jgi:hypothetical protein